MAVLRTLRPESIVVTGIGMVSALGHSAASSCASYRAGISRASDIGYFTIIADYDGEEKSVSGHVIRTITDGFQGGARLLRIALAAFQDKDLRCHSPDLSRVGVGLYVSVSNHDRVGKNETNVEQTYDQGKKSDTIGTKLCEKFVEVVNPLNVARTSRLDIVHAGFIQAIEQASMDLVTNRVTYCLVGGFDSLVEEDTLEWIEETGRLKTDERPVGFQPGEAGVFMAIEQYDIARKRDAPILAVIEAIATGFDPHSSLTTEPARGEGLSDVLAKLIEVSGDILKPVRWIITDQNGESHRASDWGHTVVRLSPRYKDLDRVSLWYPAIAFGDTGAASGGVATCLAIRAFARQFAPSNTAVVLSSSDRGERAALSISRFAE